MGIRDSHKVVLRGNKEIEIGRESYEILRHLLALPSPPEMIDLRNHLFRRDAIIWAGPKTTEGSESDDGK